jgi:hypothetical protein
LPLETYYLKQTVIMSDEHSKIAEFMDVTQTTPDEARELLESSNWNVQVSSSITFSRFLRPELLVPWAGYQ